MALTIRPENDVKGPESYIFKTVVRLAFFLINVLAIYLLLRGHALPGGGFIAGLATAISLILLSLALGFEAMHRVVRFDPVRVAAIGLIVASLTGLLPVLGGQPFLEQFNVHLGGVPLFEELHVGTPLLFDMGVYLVVVGVTSKIVFVFAKSTQGLRALVEEEEARYSAIMEKPIESGRSAQQMERRPAGKERDHAA